MRVTFSESLRRFEALVSDRARAVFEGTVDEAFKSIVDGSALTGAPGQPVGETGEIKDSWRVETRGPRRKVITSSHRGAWTIEAGRRLGQKLRLRSSRGGFHSVKRTRKRFRRIVRAVTASVVGRG
jgi:hypothetical protein